MMFDQKLFHWHLNTRRFGRQIRSFPEIDSTNRWLSENWSEFTATGAVVIADHQTNGRGRNSRTWTDSPGASLLFTLLFKSSNQDFSPSFLTMLPAISLAGVLKSRVSADHSVALKWPNDVIVNGRKIAGVLAEGTQSEGKTTVVVGMGVNLNLCREDFDEHLRDSATSYFAETNEIVSREILLAEILNQWEQLYDLLLEGKSEVIRQEWESFGPRRGAPIIRSENGQNRVGIFEGLGDSGQLLLRDEDGVLHQFFSGDIVG